MTATTHIAGNDVQIGDQLRQRCAWCGTVLVDHALSQLMYEASTPPEQRRPSTWPVGGLVEVDGGASWAVQHTDGDPLPNNACGAAHPEVTV